MQLSDVEDVATVGELVKEAALGADEDEGLLEELMLLPSSTDKRFSGEMAFSGPTSSWMLAEMLSRVALTPSSEHNFCMEGGRKVGVSEDEAMHDTPEKPDASPAPIMSPGLLLEAVTLLLLPAPDISQEGLSTLPKIILISLMDNS